MTLWIMICYLYVLRSCLRQGGEIFLLVLLNLFQHLRYRQNTLHYTKLLIEQYLSSHHVSNDTVYDHNDNNVVILAKHFLLIDASSILMAFLYFAKGWL